MASFRPAAIRLLPRPPPSRASGPATAARARLKIPQKIKCRAIRAGIARNLLDKSERQYGRSEKPSASPSSSLQKIILPPSPSTRARSRRQTSRPEAAAATPTPPGKLCPTRSTPALTGTASGATRSKLRREEAFEQTYAGRLEQQEARWARRAHAANERGTASIRRAAAPS